MKLETIGTDCEVFLKDQEGIVSAEGQVGGTKKEPLELQNGVSVQEDNVMAEFNVSPADNKKDFAANIQNGLKQLRSHVSPYDIAIVGSSYMEQEEIMSDQGIEFGCVQDYDVWNQDICSIPDPFEPLRACGGHIHVGYIDTEDSAEEIKISRTVLTKLLDLYVGVPYVVLGDETDKERASMYGTPGRYRDKPYGLEYRTVSNFWIRDEEMMKWMFDSVAFATHLMNKHMEADPNDSSPIEDHASLKIQEAIRDWDTEIAKELINEYSIKLPKHDKEKASKVHTV